MSAIDIARRSTGNRNSMETEVTKADLTVHASEAPGAPRIAISRESIGREASEQRTVLTARAAALNFCNAVPSRNHPSSSDNPYTPNCPAIIASRHPAGNQKLDPNKPINKNGIASRPIL